MAERSPGSRAARHRLGTGLRKLREHANLRLEAAAEELECSIAKISRLENGLGPAKLWDVRILLDLYGVEDVSMRRQFEEWARNSKSTGWWEPDFDLTTDDVSRYLSTETDAARLRIFCAPWLPSQLQTADYARAHITAFHPDWPAHDVDRFVNLRIARREALLRANTATEMEVVVDEAAVRRRIGTPEVHFQALSWLISTLDEIDRGTLTIPDRAVLSWPEQGGRRLHDLRAARAEAGFRHRVFGGYFRRTLDGGRRAGFVERDLRGGSGSRAGSGAVAGDARGHPQFALTARRYNRPASPYMCPGRGGVRLGA